MKITIRKRNSVTSITLFIFNLINEYKNDNTINLGILIELLKTFHKSESSIRTSLSRMVKADILLNKKKNEETFYELTQNGIKNINYWNNGISRFYKRYKLRFERWDKKWYFLNLFDFNKSKPENFFIVEDIKEFGLKEVNNNWITPYSIDEEIIKILKNEKINYLLFNGHFNTNKNFIKFIYEAYNIKNIEIKYNHFLNKINLYEKKINSKKTEDLLPILFDIGWDFYDLTTSDPALPNNLLTNWVGDKAIKKMKNIRSEITNRIFKKFKDLNI